MNYFMIAAASPTPEQRNAITFLFKGKPQYGYGHWTPDFWLITSTDYSDNSATIRDAVRDTVPGLPFAVFAVNPVPGDWEMWADMSGGAWVEQNSPPTSPPCSSPHTHDSHH